VYKNDHRAAAAKVTAELSIHLEALFPCKESDQSFTNPSTIIKGKKWCDDDKTWISDDWKRNMVR